MLTEVTKEKAIKHIRDYRTALEKRHIPNERFIILTDLSCSDEDSPLGEILQCIREAGDNDNFDYNVIESWNRVSLHDNHFSSMVNSLRKTQYRAPNNAKKVALNAIENNQLLKDSYINYLFVTVNNDDIRVYVLTEHFDIEETDLKPRDYRNLFNGDGDVDITYTTNWLGCVANLAEAADMYFWHNLDKNIVDEVKELEYQYSLR